MVLGVPYSRVSSAGQTSGLGLDRQAADPAAYCADRGWRLYDGPGYSDAGVSAFGGKNLHGGNLGRFLADAKAGRFGAEPLALLIEDVDRFSRAAPLEVLPVLIDDLLNAGLTIAVMGKGRDISSASIKANQMELHELLFWVGASHEFSERLSRRIGHVHQAKRDRIRNGEAVTPHNAPAWLDLVDGQWQLNDYAVIVRQVLAMATEGHGCHSIATTLNAKDIASPGQYRRLQWAATAKRRTVGDYKPVRWNGASVRQLLCSPALIGDRQIMTPGYKALVREWQAKCARLRRDGASEADIPKHPLRTHEAPQKGYYPPLLTEMEQAGLLAAMARRKPATGGRVDQVRWMAAGMSVCLCGQPIGAACSQRASGHHVFYLKCRGRVNASGCKQPSIRLKTAQLALLARLTAESLLSLVDGARSSQRQSTFVTAIAAQTKAQSTVDQLSASVAAGEQAMANESDAVVLGVLARRQAQQTLKLETASRELTAAQGAVQLLQTRPDLFVLTKEAQDQIGRLVGRFVAEADGPEDRRSVQHHLGRIGATVTFDGAGRRMALQIGDGEPDWQPIPSADLAGGVLSDRPYWRAVELPGGGVALVDGEIDRAAFDAAAAKVLKELGQAQ
jgi:DNA invertase Pin-like site-specific DNA recombinase